MFAIEQSALLHALGRAIGNSLWQMSALWLAYHIITGVFQMPSARKYALATGASLAGFAWFVVTFVVAYQSFSLPELVYETGITAAGTSGKILSGFQFFYHSVIATLKSLAPYLSCAYLLVMLVLSVRLVNGFKQVKQLRSSGLGKIDVNWRMFVRKHAEILGIDRNAQVYVSELAQSPLTVGFWKPVILIPLASMNHLTPQQMEAILLHELAHIRRHDYLLNIILQVAEMSLFFNPFMRLLLKQIRQERENSCDDWVLQFQYNAADYARALLVIEQTGASSLLAMGAADNNSFQLLNRVKRMVAPERQAFNYRQQLGLLFLITLLCLSFTMIVPKPKAKTDTVVKTEETTVLLKKKMEAEVEETTHKAFNLVKTLENINAYTETDSKALDAHTKKMEALGEQLEASIKDGNTEAFAADMQIQAELADEAMRSIGPEVWAQVNRTMADVPKIVKDALDKADWQKAMEEAKEAMRNLPAILHQNTDRQWRIPVPPATIAAPAPNAPASPRLALSPVTVRGVARLAAREVENERKVQVHMQRKVDSIQREFSKAQVKAMREQAEMMAQLNEQTMWAGNVQPRFVRNNFNFNYDFDVQDQESGSESAVESPCAPQPPKAKLKSKDVVAFTLPVKFTSSSNFKSITITQDNNPDWEADLEKSLKDIKGLKDIEKVEVKTRTTRGENGVLSRVLVIHIESK